MTDSPEELENREYIENNEVGEVVPENEVDQDHHMSDEDEDQVEEFRMDPEDRIEIDLSNNSSAYFDLHEDSIYLIKSHPSLPLVVTGGGDNRGYIWTTNSRPPKIVSKLEGNQESVVAGGFTFDGSYVVLGDMSGRIQVWKSASRGQKWIFHGSVQEVEEVIWIAFHPLQQIFAVGALDGSVWVYSLEPSLENISVLTSHSMTTNGGVFINTDDMDNLSLMTASEDGTIISWNVYGSSTNYTLHNKDLRGNHEWVALSISPSGKTMAAGSRDGMLALIGLANGNVLEILDTVTNDDVEREARSVEAIAWSDVLPLLAIGNVDAEIKIFDMNTLKVRRTIKIGEAVTQLQFVKGTPNLISSSMDGVIHLFDARSGEEKWTGKGHNAGVLGFAVQEEGNRIITAGDEGVSLIFNR